MKAKERAKVLQFAILSDIVKNLARYRRECEKFSMRTEDDQPTEYNESMQAFYVWMTGAWESALEQFADKCNEIQVNEDNEE